MKLIFLWLLFIFIINNCFAQRDTIHLKSASLLHAPAANKTQQAIYFGIGGSTLFFSFNYDRRFGNRANGLGFTTGIGFAPMSGASFFSLPLSVNYLFGKQIHFFEIAAGVTYARFSTSTTSDDGLPDGPLVTKSLFPNLNIGYRYKSAKGNFFGRIGISPSFFGRVATGQTFPDKSYLTVPYLGVGFSF